MHFLLFHFNRTNHSQNMANKVFDFEKMHPEFWLQKCQNKIFQQNSVNTLSCDENDWGILLPSVVMNIFHFTMQRSKFLLISVTAVTLGQGRRKVIQYYTLLQIYTFFVPNIFG